MKLLLKELGTDVIIVDFQGTIKANDYHRRVSRCRVDIVSNTREGHTLWPPEA